MSRGVLSLEPAPASDPGAARPCVNTAGWLTTSEPPEFEHGYREFIRAGKAHPSIPRRFGRKPPPSIPAASAQFTRRGRSVPDTGAVGQTDAPHEIRSKLEVATAVVCVSSAAPRAQSADNDAGVALCLQRCVGDEIDRQIERMDALLEVGAS